MALPDANRPTSSNIDRTWKNALPLTPLKSKVEESDEDIFTVPDMKARPSDCPKPSDMQQTNSSSAVAGKRKRGRNPADREYKRHKRLLRNRVSAQQARERKKVYVNDLELRAKELQDKNSKLEEKISTLVNENTMLRKVLMNTRTGGDDGSEVRKDESCNADK